MVDFRRSRHRMLRLEQAVRIFTFLGVVSIVLSIAVSESFLGLAALCWIPLGIYETREQGRLAISWPPFMHPVRLFILATILSVLFSPEPGVGLPALKKLPLFFVMFLVIRFLDFTWTKRAFYALFGLGGLAGIVSFLQFVEKWIRFMHTGRQADDPTLIFRIHGFMGHWMTFSGEQILITAALFGFVVLYPIQKRWLWWLATIVLFTSVVLSFTRSAWLAIFVVLLVVLFRFRTRLIWVIPAVLLVVWLVFPGAIKERLGTFVNRSFSSNTARIEMIEGGWSIFRQHPWVGVGPERIHGEFEAYLKAKGVTNPPYYTGHLHDNFVQLAAERGLLALVAFVWLVGELLIRFWIGSRMFQISTEQRAIFLSALLATIALVVAGLFEFNFGDSEVFILFLFMISAPYVRGWPEVGELSLPRPV